MYCHQCGSKLAEEAKFCSSCGTPVANTLQSEDEILVSELSGELKEAFVSLFNSTSEVSSAKSAKTLEAQVWKILDDEIAGNHSYDQSVEICEFVLQHSAELHFSARIVVLTAILSRLQFPGLDYYLPSSLEQIVVEMFVLGTDRQIAQANWHFLVSYSNQPSQHFLAGVSTNPKLPSELKQVLMKLVDEYSRPILAANPNMTRSEVRKLIQLPSEQEIVGALIALASPGGIAAWQEVFDYHVFSLPDFVVSITFIEEILKSICLELEDSLPSNYQKPEPLETEIASMLIGDEVLIPGWYESYASDAQEFADLMSEGLETGFYQYFQSNEGFQSLVRACSWEEMQEWVSYYDEEISPLI